MSKWRAFYHSNVWSNLHSDPRTAPSDNIKLCTYHNWFAPPLPSGHQKWSPAPYISHPHMPYQHSIALAKFRTSSHHLSIETLRGKTVRSARICPLCNQGVQDEHHIVFDCTAMNNVKGRYPKLWATEANSLSDLFNCPDNSGILASFVLQILRETEPH
jgi:hypothetical protein